jgi:hypothetical protein
MKKIDIIQRSIVLLAFLFSAQFLLAQSTNTEFFMTSSPANIALNPAKRPEKGYIGIPGFTNFKLDYRTNTFTLDQFLYPGLGKDGKTAFFMNEAISYSQFMNGISDNNFLHLGADYTPMGFGFYIKKVFLSVDASLRMKTAFNLPGSFFSFLKKGLNESGDDLSYDFKNASATATAFAQLGAGASYPFLNNSLVVGAKAKLLFGIANAHLQIDQMHLNLAHDQWNVRSQASMHLTYPNQNIKYDDQGVFTGVDADGDQPLLNGSGMGFDLGVTFTPGRFFDFGDKLGFLNRFTVSAALIDLGSITWKNNIYLATNPNDVLITDGNRSTNFENFGDLFDEFSDSVDDVLAFRKQQGHASRTTPIGSQLNLGLEYNLNDHFNLGYLSTTRYDPVETVSEHTLGAAYYPATGFEVGMSYSFVYSRFRTFGLAIRIGSGFFIAADYLLPQVANADFITLPIPTTVRAFNLQMGCVVPIGGRH